MSLKILILTLTFCLILNISYGFILEVKQTQQKCFKSQQSPDKTLQVKLGFPRRQQQNCNVLFSVHNVISQNQRYSIFNDVLKCHQVNPGQLTVIKHTSQETSSEGFYQICYHVMQNTNQNLLIEIFIGERLNPLLYSDGEDVLPLIQSEELINLDLKIQNIKRSLGWSRKLLNEGKQKGNELQLNLSQLDQFTFNITIIQISVLIAYALLWIAFMKSQKRT